MCVDSFWALLSLGVKPVYMYISLYLISKREVILSITSVKSESAVLVCVCRICWSQSVTFWLEPGSGNLCHRPSVEETSCHLGDSKCESLQVTEFEREVLTWLNSWNPLVKGSDNQFTAAKSPSEIIPFGVKPLKCVRPVLLINIGTWK